MTIDVFLSKVYDAILEPLLFVVFAFALIIFITGIVEFIAKSDNEKAREKGRDSMIWGLVGMLIMVSFWGIINIIVGTIGADLPPGSEVPKGKFEDSINKVRIQ
jgi:hypothetical protein